MYIYRKSGTEGLWNRAFIADIEYAVTLAINSTVYSGKKVSVYSDPITRQSLEGQAVIVEIIRQDIGDSGYMYCVVDFQDGFVVERIVNIKDVVK